MEIVQQVSLVMLARRHLIGGGEGGEQGADPRVRSALGPMRGPALWGPQRQVLGQVAIHAQALSHTPQPVTDAGRQLTAPFGKERTGLILSTGASEAGFAAAHAA